MKDEILNVILTLRNQSKAMVVEKVNGKLKRKRELVLSRHLYYYFCRRYTKLSIAKIGEMFYQDHATVLHGCNSIQNLIDTNIKIRHDIKQLDEIISVLKQPTDPPILFPTMYLRWYNSRLQQKYITSEKDEVWREVDEFFVEEANN